jgi:hypothetical protein
MVNENMRGGERERKWVEKMKRKRKRKKVKRTEEKERGEGEGRFFFPSLWV